MVLSIVIATFNRKNYLAVLLDQIRKQKSHPFVLNVIVVNDGSGDGTGDLIVNEFPEVTMISGNGDWWWTKCMNEGFKKALSLKSDFVLILNDDNELPPDYLKQLAEIYKKVPEGSILGSMSLSIENPGLIEMSGTKSFNRYWLKARQYLNPDTKHFDENTILPSSSLSGRGTFIPVTIFQKIGLYDEKLVQYGSDDEFIWRARKQNISALISWKLKVLNHSYLTSSSASIKRISFWRFTRSFFNAYSANSLYKIIYLYVRYGYAFFLPIYLVYTILGSYKAYYFNFRRYKR